MATITGGSVLSLQTFLERSYGEDAFARVLDALPPATAQPLRGIVLPVNRYPTHSFVAAIHAARETFANPRVFEEYGAFAAEFEINLFQRIFLRFSSPLFLMDRAGRVWGRFHDTGEWQVEGTVGHLKGTLRNFAIVDAGYCRVLTAWIQRAVQMTGVTGEVHHPECRARGAPACVFEGYWT